MQPIMQAKGIVKKYLGTQALKGVDFDVWPGRVNALIGGKRRGQVHADEDPGGHRKADRRQAVPGRKGSPLFRRARGAHHGRGHHPPGAEPVSRYDGGRQHVRRPRNRALWRDRQGGAAAKGRRGLKAPAADNRPERTDAEPARRAAADRGDREDHAPAGTEGADHGRTHLVAFERRGRGAVQAHRGFKEPRHRGHLHLAPAGGDHPHLRQRDGAPGRKLHRHRGSKRHHHPLDHREDGGPRYAVH